MQLLMEVWPCPVCCRGADCAVLAFWCLCLVVACSESRRPGWLVLVVPVAAACVAATLCSLPASNCTLSFLSPHPQFCRATDLPWAFCVVVKNILPTRTAPICVALLLPPSSCVWQFLQPAAACQHSCCLLSFWTGLGDCRCPAVVSVALGMALL